MARAKPRDRRVRKKFPDPDDDRRRPSEYTGRDRYVEWIEDYLGVTLTVPQKRIIYAIMDNQKTMVIAANGFGKTYMLACFTLAFLFLNYPASVLATSGTYAKLRRTYCKPIEKLHGQAWGLPGRYLQHPPRIVIDSDPEVYWEAASPRDAGELEGVHNEYTLGIVEEADKDAVDQDVFDSLDSLLTDDKDKLIAVANPPKDEANVVYDLMDDPGWNTMQFSSFEAHNVLLERGEIDGQKIEGLVTLDQIKSDWESWNREPWPGYEAAKHSGDRDDLDIRWYRRRLGIISPKTAEVHRPFSVSDVENAYNREPSTVTHTPQGLGLDVARGGGRAGDSTAMAGVFGQELRLFDYWRLGDHTANEERVRSILDDSWTAPFAIDDIGSGEGLSDRINTFYPNRVKFKANALASDPHTYTDAITEGLCMLGEFLRDGGSFRNARLREEMLAAAKVSELSETYSGKYDTNRLDINDWKDNVKDRIDRSPDLLDAAIMAVWVAQTEGHGRRKVPSSF